MRPEHIIKRLNDLKTLRQPHEETWKEAYKYASPENIQTFNSGGSYPHSGVEELRKQARKELYETTLVDSTQLLVASIINGTTSPNTKWFTLAPVGLNIPTELTEGDKWLEQVSNLIFKNIHAHGFDSIVSEYVLNLVVAGWAVLYISSKEEGGFMFENWNIGSCYISSTLSDGSIDTVFREYQLSVEQAVNEFGLDKVSDKTKNAYNKGDRDTKITVVHAILPRPKEQVSGEEGKRINTKMPYASYQVEIDTKHILNESGYEEFPLVVARFKRILDSHYGIGIATMAVPDAKTANQIVKLTLQSAELALQGLWVAKHDGVVNPSTLRIRPRAIIMANSVDSIKRLDTGSQSVNIGIEMLVNFTDKIKRTMMSDMLTPIGSRPLTATEIQARTQNNRMALGAIYGRMQSEYLKGLLERCWGLVMRANVLPPAPEELQAADRIVFDFINPLANAQKLEGVIATQNLLGDITAMMEVDPNIIDNINLDAAVQLMADGYGTPKGIINTMDEVMQIRQAKEDAQAAQQEQEMNVQSQQQMSETMGGIARDTANKMQPDQVMDMMENGM